MAGLSSGMAKKTGAKSSPARGNRFCGLLVGGGIEARDQSGPMDSEGGVLRHFQEMVRDGSFDMEDDIPVILEISRTGGLVNWSIPSREQIDPDRNPLCPCGEPVGGDGWDGRCGNCADRAGRAGRR